MANSLGTEASDILQTYLDEVADAVMTNNWEVYRDGVSLPCHIVSHDESKVVTTEAELRDGFNQFRETLLFHRITDYVRLVDAASRLDSDLISGSYVSHLVSGGQRLMPPFRSQMTLRVVGNRWRAASVTNALANSRWPLVRLAIHPEKISEGPDK